LLSSAPLQIPYTSVSHPCLPLLYLLLPLLLTPALTPRPTLTPLPQERHRRRANTLLSAAIAVALHGDIRIRRHSTV
jgi:hypothetical protein